MVAAGVVLLILLITLFKMNTFVSLIITSFIVALMLRLPVAQLPTLIEKGLGGQFGTIAIVFGFGAMLGKLLSDSGGGYRIAHTLIQKFGRRYIEIAVILTSFIVGLALFFEVGLVVLLPIIYVIANEADMPLAMLGFPMAATLNIMHGFLPPHPAATAVAASLKAPLGQVIILGLIAAIPTIIIAGPVFNHVLRKVYPSIYKKHIVIPALGKVKKFNLKDTPSFGVSVITAVMPVILIALGTIFNYALPKKWAVSQAIQFIGSPDVAMLISLIIAIFTMGIAQGRKMKQVGQSMEKAIKQIAMMMMIIAGSGAFKQVLVSGGVAKYISTMFAHTSMSPLIAAWLITAIIRVSLGSSTVASLTSAGLVGPLMVSSGINPALMVLAIGAGSIFCDHVNDAGFWMVKEFFGLSLKQTFASWTVLTTVISVVGLLAVLAESLFV
ncbi:gluconate:H+ symporter [Acetilactobacillus jinshanensis]|uniref:Gluconate permease n=1 Tax=Acetilactobacillus jinshanensis TaxID=1720083 RepID=A0A4P6ZLL7_9LACO|nr:gluconate:H+ symporter [Acetilactobacillus jinshanensis]QBP18447.1 gluconate permease [Acetilactobacillus jinshanensis]URL61919.1 gluconate permease [uncultured bacterium]